MVRMTLRQCRYFLAVIDCGGITQAARALNISQPAVSQALDKLEDAYGFKLVTRHHARGTEPTPQGRAFAASVRTLLDTAMRVEHEALSIASHLAGRIRFGCFHTIAPFFMTQIMTSYGARHPGIEIEASELLQDDIVSRIASGELDLALTYDMGLDDAPLTTRTVALLEPFLLLSCDHPLATRSAVALAEMAREPFVLFDGPASRGYFTRVLSDHGIDPPVGFRSGSMETVRCAVANGLGFSLSVMRPSHAGTYDGGRIASVPISDDTDGLPLVVATRKDGAPSELIDRFADFCATAVAAHEAGSVRSGPDAHQSL